MQYWATAISWPSPWGRYITITQRWLSEYQRQPLTRKQSIRLSLGLVVVLSTLVLRGPALLGHVWINAGLMVLSQAQISTSDTSPHNATTQAETLFRLATAYAPENRFTWWGLGLALAAQGREDEAMAAWQTAGGMMEELIQRGEALRAVEQYEEALVWYERAQLLTPDSGEPWYYEGLAYEGMQEWEKALRAHERAIELAPSDLRPHYAIGNILLNKRRDDERALRIYQIVAALDPLPVMAYLGIGTALDRLHREQEALSAYQKAASLSHQVEDNTTEDKQARVWPHYALGDFYLRRGQLDEAKHSFEEALAQDSDKDWAGWSLWGLGRIALQEEKYSEVTSYFDQVLEIATTPYLRSQAYAGIGQVYIQQGDIYQGVSYLQRAHAEHPDNRGLHRYLADVLREAGYYEKAVVEYERYLQEWPGDQSVIQALQETRQLLEASH